MQLTKKRSVRHAVAAMTTVLLGSGAATAASTPGRVQSSLLLYSETNRVQAAEGVVGVSKDLINGGSFGLHLTLDGLTGASPNGATPSSKVQTFTGPSGNRGYTVQPGEVPLDNTFKDTRYALDGNVSLPLGRLSQTTFGAHVSGEHDYSSVGLNAGITRDFFRRNTTLAVNVSYSHDVSSPVGGVPTALTAVPPPSSSFGEGEDEGGASGPGKGKNIYDIVTSLTQVINRETLIRLNYSFDRSSGYLNDPYKILSVVAPEGAANPGDPVTYLYESRPSSRKKQAVFGEIRRYIAGHTIDLSYRYFWDDWGIRSNTAEVFYRIPLGGGKAIQPHFRWYHQNQADFYTTYLVDGQLLPAHASADTRLSTFTALTMGLEYSVPVEDLGELSFSGEYYTQLEKRGPPDAIGVLKNYDLFPKLNVFMLRIGFSRDF